MSLKKWSRWFNHRIHEGKKFFKEIGRWFSGKSLQDVDKTDIIFVIGYFMIKTIVKILKLRMFLNT